MTRAAVVGAGLTRFGRYLDSSLYDLAAQAVNQALGDAQVDADDIDMIFVANAMASVTTGQASIVGQAALRPLGFAGVPLYNVDNACAGSSTALELAVHAIESGRARRTLILGVEKLHHRDKRVTYRALNGAVESRLLEESAFDTGAGSFFVTHVYPERLSRYEARFGLTPETLATISVKNRRHASLNPLAQYQAPLTVQDVLGARPVAGPVTTLMCAPISDGASAVVVVHADDAPGPARSPVWIRGIASAMGGSQRCGMSVMAATARRAYAETGIDAGQIDVAEVHDSISFNELLAYEELGLCGEGEGAKLVTAGDTDHTGRIPVNTSGGLESRGHPVAATGLAQITELVTQLRGQAGARQVPGARFAVAENAGGYAVDDTASIAVTVLSTERGW